MGHPRIVVLADGTHDGLAYLRKHPEADFAAIRPEDLQGVPIGKVVETPQFATQRTPRAKDLRREAARRLNSYFIQKETPAVPAIHAASIDPELSRRFDYHRPTPERVLAHEAIREAHRNLATVLAAYVPPGREHSLALTNLEQSMMWANAGIAREASNA